MKLTLSLTHKCNLACRYCYAGYSDKPDMSLITAQRSIDTALLLTDEGGRLELALFGGEPLLRLDLVKESTAYAQQRAAMAGVSLRIGITTNGTLVSPTVLDYTEAERISLCFSLDGPPEIHDRTPVSEWAWQLQAGAAGAGAGPSPARSGRGQRRVRSANPR
jgi:uncharacterized protein